MTYSNAQIARHLGVAPSIVSLWRKKTPPIPNDSLDAAARWRLIHAPARGKRSSKLAEAAQDVPQEPITTTTISSPTPPAPATDTSWKARLDRCQKTELRIYDSLEKSIDTGDLVALQKLQSSHVAACREVADIELVALEVQTKARDLVPIDEVKNLMAGILDPLRRSLDRLPVTLAYKCNPGEPAVARQVLQRAVDRLLATMRREVDQFFGHPPEADESVLPNAPLTESKSES